MNRTVFPLPSAAAGRTLCCVLREPDTEPRAVLQIVHGMAEHIGRYAPFAEWLCARGFAVMGHDQLGHGHTVPEGREEDFGYFAEEGGAAAVIRDIRTVTVEAKRRFPGCPVFLLGHSMGSFFVRRYLTSAGGELAGAILLGAAWIPGPMAKTGLLLSNAVCRTKGDRCESPMLDRLVLGRAMSAFPGGDRYAWLTKDADIVREYEADPLCGIPFKAGAYRDFFSVMLSVAKEEEYDGIRRTLPILVASGENDPIGGKKAAGRIAAEYRGLDFSDVELMVFPGDRHEILNEGDREEVYESIRAWMDRHVARVTGV